MWKDLEISGKEERLPRAWQQACQVHDSSGALPSRAGLSGLLPAALPALAPSTPVC